MTKGIREFVAATFAALLPSANFSTREGCTAFRKAVMSKAIETHGISIASAATHYNHAFQEQRTKNPESVKGLGRPADKIGGRKPVHLYGVRKVSDGTMIAEGISKAKALAMIQLAVDKKKAKLELVEPAKPAAAETPSTGTSTETQTIEGNDVGTLNTQALEQTPETAPQEAEAQPA
jgi:hypothetical protein